MDGASPGKSGVGAAVVNAVGAWELSAVMDEKQTLSPSETALYIERMCSELRNMAAVSDMNFLAYLLDVAREEASEQVGTIRVPAKKTNLSL